MKFNEIKLHDELTDKRDEMLDKISRVWPATGAHVSNEDIQTLIKDAFDAGSRSTMILLMKRMNSGE